MVTILVIIAYWLFGALLFDEIANVIENEHWGYGNAMYYAAITFPTVGFGDYSLRWYGHLRALEVSLFIVFTTIGLVLFVEFGTISARPARPD